MDMFKTLNIKEITMLLGTFVLWGMEVLLFTLVIPQYNNIIIDLIGLFFVLISLIFIRYAIKVRQKQFTPRKEITVIMAFSMLPLLLSLTFILMYVCFVKENTLIFVITFGSFYLWFLIMKSAVLYKLDTKNINSKSLQYED
jgi:small-conductance mechanosensitive channel